ncbi:MAG: hypothetical protein HC827_13905 [Cyanobacteria bacterium RM1_2_2]|nr:hypothetical protein [Cyanobacteria bacterium RM1_2_2]
MSIFTTYSKLQSVLSRLETRDLKLQEQMQQMIIKMEHQDDRTELLFNGLKERIEHISLRLTTQQKEIASILSDVEAYLQKNTSYERRSR